MNLANKIYGILVELAGASENNRHEFVRWFEDGCPGREYRFGGAFAGAKFWQSDRWYVSCYQEFETPEILNQISIINERLASL